MLFCIAYVKTSPLLRTIGCLLLRRAVLTTIMLCPVCVTYPSGHDTEFPFLALFSSEAVW